jgi:hypothetical protein
MNKNINNNEVFLFFFYLDSSNNYIKNENMNELNQYNNDNKCVIYFYIDYNSKINCFKELDYNISYKEFPFRAYLTLNKDLNQSNQIITKQQLWDHWINNGIKEERTYSYINNSSIHKGRLGNIFFINMYLHFMSMKHNLKCYYKHYKLFNQLGIYFNNGSEIYKNNYLVNDDNFLNILTSDRLCKSNLIIQKAWFQNMFFCNILKQFFSLKNIKNKIINKNIYKSRYKTNNDLFLHLRLDDVSEITMTKDNYYIELLSKIKYDKGFISSDSISHPLCLLLIEKFQLSVIDYREVETIMFGSTCNNIILSGGTFSWLIGFLAFYSNNIYYPEIEQKWYGDIFSCFNWNKM